MNGIIEDLFQIYIAKNYPGWDKLPPGNGFKINIKDAFFAGYESKQTTTIKKDIICPKCGTGDKLSLYCDNCRDITHNFKGKNIKRPSSIPVDVVKEMMLKWVGEEAVKHIEVLIGEYLREQK